MLHPVGNVYITVAVPAPTPVTTPVSGSAVSLAVLPLVHMPPADALAIAAVLPAQTFASPVIGSTDGCTDITALLKQPFPKVYDMDAVPAATAVTTPVDEPIDAIVSSLLDHVPPGLAFERTIVRPWHTEEGPAISAGKAFTVTWRNLRQPLAPVYVTVDKPAATPVTSPAAFTVAKPLETDQLPPGVAFDNVVISPAHTDAVPVMGSGTSVTVIAVVATQPDGSVYITLVTPALAANVAPVAEPTTAIAMSPALQVPPGVALESRYEDPLHMAAGAAIGAGSGFTTIFIVRKQPVDNV